LLTSGATSFEKLSKEREGKEQEEEEEESQDKEESATSQPGKKKTLSQHKVRTSLQERMLDSMFPIINPARIKNDNKDPSSSFEKVPSKPRDVPESDCALTSVCSLRQAVLKGKHQRKTPTHSTMSFRICSMRQ
jgi:DNA mismatch repair protein MLH1